jgi:hypothetical protein
MIATVKRASRQELYEQVWSEPMQTLASRYGMSDVALAKNCRKLNIPLPGRGYWAKKAAGKAVVKVPLPELPPNSPLDSQTLTAREATPPVTPKVESLSKPQYLPPPVAAQATFEANPRNRIVVHAGLREPHALVEKTIAALQADQEHDPKDWRYKPATRLDMRVTKRSLNRALRVLDTILKAFQRRGWKAAMSKDQRDQGETLYVSHVNVINQQVFFGIREVMERVRIAPDERSSATAGRSSKNRETGTGRLSFTIYQPHTRNVRYEFVEAEPGDMHEVLNDIMVKIVASAFQDVEEIAYRSDEWFEQQQAETRRQEERRRREDEASRVRALIEQAASWAESEILRQYVDAVRDAAAARTGGLEPDSELAAWLGWAEQCAANANPLRQSLEELVSDRREAPPQHSPPPARTIEKLPTPYWFFRRR